MVLGCGVGGEDRYRLLGLTTRVAGSFEPVGRVVVVTPPFQTRDSHSFGIVSLMKERICRQ